MRVKEKSGASYHKTRLFDFVLVFFLAAKRCGGLSGRWYSQFLLFVRVDRK